MLPIQPLLMRNSGTTSVAVNAALARKTTTQTFGTTFAALAWEGEVYDSSNFHDLVTNNSRMTIPAGLSLARVQSAVLSTNQFTPHIKSQKGGSDHNGQFYANVKLSGGNLFNNGYSAPIAVLASDYFECDHLVLSGTSSPGTENPTWFAVEALSSSLKYALVQKSANQSISAATFTTLTWNTEVADTDSWHDTVTNNSRLTVPSGVSLVRVSANVVDANATGRMFSRLKKNGSTVVGLPTKTGEVGTSEAHNLVSAPMVVTAGDYFEVEVWEVSATSILSGTYTWAAIEEIPSTWKRVLVSKSANQAITNGVSTAVTFDQETYDTDSFHDNATNNTRLTVPSGVTKARISYGVGFSSTGDSTTVISKNGAGTPTAGFYGAPGYASAVTAGANYHSGISAWVDVTPGDYFEIIAAVGVSQNIITGPETWFAMECQ